MTNIDPLLLSITKRVKAICIAIKEVQQLKVERQVKDALAIQNRPNTLAMLNLPLQLEVYIQRKKD